MNNLISHDEERAKLLGSLLLFTRTFFKLRTGREFELSNPISRESHYITICRELTKVFRGEIKRDIINIPPRYGKTELLIHFVAWTLARYPDSNFLYVCYSHSLAAKQTRTIRDIINLREYQELFGVNLNKSSTAKHDFETTAGGSVYAAGTDGTITGRGAGIKGTINRFGGAILIDDAHKPSEVSSDITRETVIERYHDTINKRLNQGSKTPIIFIGQRLHEGDLAGHLLETENWDSLVLKGLDDAGNAIDPSLHTKEELLEMQEKEPYVFAAQFQQNPLPAGGGLYKKEWFYFTETDPEFLFTFITADTAETEKSCNDATVFSFWGLYKIVQEGIETDVYGLHWIDCLEIRVEPKDLKPEFLAFYAKCMTHTIKPRFAGIEKKSTGVTLVSVLSDFQGLEILPITRTKASGSKTERYLELQPYIARHLITFSLGSDHAQMCITHCSKITANNSHRHDDIADTLYDAVKITLIDEISILRYSNPKESINGEIAKKNIDNNNRLRRLKGGRSWRI